MIQGLINILAKIGAALIGDITSVTIMYVLALILGGLFNSLSPSLLSTTVSFITIGALGSFVGGLAGGWLGRGSGFLVFLIMSLPMIPIFIILLYGMALANALSSPYNSEILTTLTMLSLPLTFLLILPFGIFIGEKISTRLRKEGK